MGVRAGKYAVYDGFSYSASFASDTRAVLLFAPEGTSPPGFTPTLSGRFKMTVDRSQISYLEKVETHAVWQGRRVEVKRVTGSTAVIQQWQWPVPDHPAAYAIENGLWGAKVPVEELTEVVETVTEVPSAL